MGFFFGIYCSSYEKTRLQQLAILASRFNNYDAFICLGLSHNEKLDGSFQSKSQWIDLLIFFDPIGCTIWASLTILFPNIIREFWPMLIGYNFILMLVLIILSLEILIMIRFF